MDEESASKLNQSWGEANWSRDLHARLLDRLAAFRAKAVVFDVLFRAPGTNDSLFFNSIRSTTNAGIPVVVGGKTDVGTQAGTTSDWIDEPFDALRELVPWGLAEKGNPGTTLREHFPGARGEPSLAWRAAQSVRIAPLPAQDAPRWIRYYGPPLTLRHQSYKDVLDTNLDLSSTFSNKVCFVGVRPGIPTTGGLRVDEWATPFGESKVSGVEINTTVYLNLARGDWLERWSVRKELLVLLLTGALLGPGFTVLRPSQSLLVGAASAAVAAAANGWLVDHYRT